MELVDQIVKQVRWLLQKPTAELTRAQATLRYMIDLTRHCARELHQDRATQMAAALTYHTLFSLIPTLVLMLVVMRVFVTDAELQQFKDTTVGYVIEWLEKATADISDGIESQSTGSKLQEISGDVTADPDTAVSQQPDEAVEPADAVVSNASISNETGEVPDENDFGKTAKALRQNIQKWLNDLQNVSFKSIGIVGVLLFIYAATGLLATIERSFNQIYGVSSNRPWYVRLPMYYTVITLGPLLIVLGQFVQGQLIGWLNAESWTKWLVGPLAVITPLLATWLVLFTMYCLLPTTRVRLRPAVIGSFIAAAGWVIGIELFGIYVRGAASTTLYGALALLPLLLLWLWITWLIILFGLELTYTLQGMRGRNLKSMARTQDADLFVDPKWLIPVMVLIGQRFERGQTARVESLSRAIALPQRATRRLVDHLQTAGLVNRIEASETEDPGYTLAKPADKIPLSRLLEVGQKLSLERGQAQKIPGREVIAELNSAERRAAGNETLANVLNRNGDAGVEAPVASDPAKH